MVEHVKVVWFSSDYADVDGRRLRPLKVYECTVEIGAGEKLETSPKRRVECEDRTPMPADVRGCDQVPLAGAVLEDPR